MLHLYGASHSERNYLEEKVDSAVPKYTIHCLIVKVCLFQKPDSFSLDRREEEENRPEETQQPLLQDIRKFS